MVEDLTVSSPAKETDYAASAAAVPADEGGGGGGGGGEEVVSSESSSSSALRDNISKKGKNAYYYAHAHRATGPEWDGKIEPRLLGSTSSSSSSSSINLSSSFSDVVTGIVGRSSFDGSGAPSSSSSSSSSSGVGRSKAVAPIVSKSKSNITNYAFHNENVRVKVYVDLPGVGNCRDEDVLLDYTERSLCLVVKNYVPPSPLPPPATAKGVGGVSDELVVDCTSAAAAVSPPPQDAAEEGGEEEEGGGGGGVVSKGEDRCLSFVKLHAEIEKATYRKKADRVIITLTKKDRKAWSKVVA